MEYIKQQCFEQNIQKKAGVKVEVEAKDKFCLNIEEAGSYFGIGTKKLRRLAKSRIAGQFVLYNGTKILIKRQKFERFLDDVSEI